LNIDNDETNYDKNNNIILISKKELIDGLPIFLGRKIDDSLIDNEFKKLRKDYTN
jgi:hypothetical protein